MLCYNCFLFLYMAFKASVIDILFFGILLGMLFPGLKQITEGLTSHDLQRCNNYFLLQFVLAILCSAFSNCYYT